MPDCHINKPRNVRVQFRFFGRQASDTHMTAAIDRYRRQVEMTQSKPERDYYSDSELRNPFVRVRHEKRSQTRTRPADLGTIIEQNPTYLPKLMEKFFAAMENAYAFILEAGNIASGIVPSRSEEDQLLKIVLCESIGAVKVIALPVYLLCLYLEQWPGTFIRDSLRLIYQTDGKNFLALARIFNPAIPDDATLQQILEATADPDNGRSSSNYGTGNNLTIGQIFNMRDAEIMRIANGLQLPIDKQYRVRNRLETPIDKLIERVKNIVNANGTSQPSLSYQQFCTYESLLTSTVQFFDMAPRFILKLARWINNMESKNVRANRMVQYDENISQLISILNKTQFRISTLQNGMFFIGSIQLPSQMFQNFTTRSFKFSIKL